MIFRTTSVRAPLPQWWTLAVGVSIIALTVSACSDGGSETPANSPSTVASEGVAPTGPAEGEQPIAEPDLDGDGVADSLDSDDDNDGFLDVDDSAPRDPNTPGDFSTPEAILDDTLVRNAITEAEAQGFTIDALIGGTPPDLGGYYLEPDDETTFVASDNGESVGGTRLGAEFRYDFRADGRVDGAVVSFDGNEPRAYSFSSNALVRGESERYSRYSRSRLTCTVDGANFSVLFVGISTGRIDANSGDIVGRRRLSVSVATDGTRTERCNQLIAGGAEIVGGWSASESSRVFRVEPTEYRFMCVTNDRLRAFAPTESWTEENGESCTCTTDYSRNCG